MGQTLSHDPQFKDKAERIFTISDLVDKSVKSEEVKNVVKAVSVAEPLQKVKLLHQAAKEVGLKNWQCPTLRFLFN